MKLFGLLKYIQIILIGLSLFSCIATKEEREIVEKYKLEQVFFEKKIIFKEIKSIENIIFTAKQTSERFTIDLYYLNFNTLYLTSQKDDLENIYKSLNGFSIELYDKSQNKLIYSYSIGANEKPSINMALPSLFLGSTIKVKNGKTYELIIKIPQQNSDLSEKYLHPVLVGGILKKPWL